MLTSTLLSKNFDNSDTLPDLIATTTSSIPVEILNEENKTKEGKRKVKKRFMRVVWHEKAKNVPILVPFYLYVDIFTFLLLKTIKKLVLIYGSKKNNINHYGRLGPWKN